MCVVTFSWEETDSVEKAKRFEETKTLSWAVIELTSLCNFNCLWCYASSNSNGQHMTKENAERLIQILADSGIKQITCSGGEPLMYPYIREFVKDASDHEMIVHMNTNGYFLTKELAKELYELGLTQVQINIDSLKPEIHDYIRGKKGSFNRAVQALKNARDVGLTCVSQTVLTKLNEKEIIDIFKFARSIGVQRCRVWDMIMEGRAKEKMDLGPTNYIDTLKKLTKFTYETGAQSIESGDPLFPQNYKTDLNVFGGYCGATVGLFLTISPKGDVYFCAALRDKLYNVFNIDSGGYKIAEFHKSKLKKYLQQFKTISECFKCDFLNKCKGGCPSRRKYSESADDYWCKILKNP
jgi:radical SAM protein with 4Fe4S-binding SPASM domain